MGCVAPVDVSKYIDEERKFEKGKTGLYGEEVDVDDVGRPPKEVEFIDKVPS